MGSTFAHAPVTKGIVITLCITSLLFSGRRYLLDVPLTPHLTRDHQYWRLIVHNLAFESSSELFLAVLLLWQVGISIERMYGSIRFASFLFVSACVSTALELAVLIFGNRSFGLRAIPAGPHAILFSLLYQAHRLLPPLYTYRISYLALPSQLPSYVLASQVFLLSPWTSLIGVVVGAAYRAPYLPLSKWRLPRPVVRLLAAVLRPVLVTSSGGGMAFEGRTRRPNHTTWADDPRYAPNPNASSPTASATGRAGAAAATALTNTAAGLRRLGNPTATPPSGAGTPAGGPPRGTGGTVTTEQVQELQEMFPQRSGVQVRTALDATRGNVPAAVERLLSQS